MVIGIGVAIIGIALLLGEPLTSPRTLRAHQLTTGEDMDKPQSDAGEIKVSKTRANDNPGFVTFVRFTCQ